MTNFIRRFKYSNESLLIYSPLDGSKDRLATALEEQMFTEIRRLREALEQIKAAKNIAHADSTGEIYHCVISGGLIDIAKEALEGK